MGRMYIWTAVILYAPQTPTENGGGIKIKYFSLFISHLVPGYLKGHFCYLRGFYLEIEHHPGTNQKKKKINALYSTGKTV